MGAGAAVRRARAGRERGEAMSGLYLVSLALSVLLLGYLTAALLWPERFS